MPDPAAIPVPSPERMAELYDQYGRVPSFPMWPDRAATIEHLAFCWPTPAYCKMWHYDIPTTEEEAFKVAIEIADDIWFDYCDLDT